MRGGRITVAAIAVALLGLVLAGSAQACSCIAGKPVESLARSDAALVGRLLAVEPSGPTQADYRYEVLRVYRGRNRIAPGSTLTVRSAGSSAACGLPEEIGRHFGLFLLARDGAWWGGLCGVIAPRRLGKAARDEGAGRMSEAGSSGGTVNCAG